MYLFAKSCLTLLNFLFACALFQYPPCLFCWLLPTLVKSVFWSPDTPPVFAGLDLSFLFNKTHTCIQTSVHAWQCHSYESIYIFCSRRCEANCAVRSCLKANGSVNSFPKDLGIRDGFLKSVFPPVVFRPGLTACSAHFSPGCFLNKAQCSACFAKTLMTIQYEPCLEGSFM